MINKSGLGYNLLIFILVTISIISLLAIVINLPFVLSNPQPLNATGNPSYVGDAITLNVTKVFTSINVNFSANWTSNNVSLSSFIFSINANGSFLNSSAYTFGSTGAAGNVSSNATFITAASGTNVTFQFIVNDSSNIFNSTLVQSFLVQNYPGPIQNSNTTNLSYSRIFPNTYVNFSANWSEGGWSLSSFIFSINNGSGFVNSSAYTFGSTGAAGNVSSNTTLVIGDSGRTVSWQFIVNDTNNNFNSTLVSTFIIANNPNPVANSNVKNNTAVVPNMYVNFSANWTEPGWSLSSFIFSIEQNGTWINSSAYTFGSTGAAGNVSSNITFITASIGTRVYWQFIVNDSNNNFNSTTVQSFIVSGGGPQLNIVFNNTPTLNIGNNSQIYNFTIIVNNTGVINASIPINVTLLLPIGITNNTNTDCDLGFTFTNRTTNTCIFNVTAGSSGIHTGASPANFTFYRAFRASHTAYNNYTSQTWIAQGRCLNCSSGNAVNFTTTASITGNPFWINPRPYLFTYGAVYNSTLVFDEWGQIRSYYEVWVPIMTWNSTANRPNPSNNSYADVIYADKPFFSNPTYIELWGYRLNFTIYFNNTNSEGNTTYNIHTPFLVTGNQTLIPMTVFNTTVTRQSGNTTTSYAFPVATGFTVWYSNNSGQPAMFTDTSLIANYSVNVSYNTVYGRTSSDGTLNTRLLTVTAPSNRGNVTISLLFSLTTNETNPTTTSPIYVKEQVLTGFTPNSAPATPSGNINTSYFVEIINPLANFTLTDLRVKFLVPLSVNITNLTTFANGSYSITPESGLNVTWRSNGSDWQGGKNMFISSTNFSFVDNTPASATNNFNVTVFFRFYEINLTNANFSNWDPTSQTALGLNRSTISNITANMTARMFFPLINKTFINSSNCAAGDGYSYNVTMNMAQRGALNLTDELGSCFDANKENIDIRVDGVVLNESANRTIGSLVINDVGQGSHSVAVSYTVKRTSGGSSGGGTSTSGDTGGAAATTKAIEEQVAASQTIIFSEIKPGVEAVFNSDPSKKFDISKILISVKNTVSGASLTLTKIKELPSSVKAPNVKVYTYYLITKDVIKDDNLLQLKIEFSLPKSFLTSNSINADSIKLFRFTDKWDALQTEKLSEDSTKVNYRATSSGTSYFAIASEEVTAEEAPEPSEVVEVPVEKVPSRNYIWVIIVIIVVILLIAYLIMKKRKE